MIIDIHSHLKRNFETKKYEYEEFLNDMNENDIDIRVVSSLEGSNIRSTNDIIINFVKEYPNKLIGCGVINPKEDNCLEEAERLTKYSEIKMIEFNSLEHGYRPEKLEKNIDPIFDLAEKNNLIIKVFTGHGFNTMPEQWGYYLKKHKKIKMIILHMGGSDFAYGTVEFAKDEPNVLLDTSYETELQTLRKAFNDLSNDKLLYGSNYPDDFTDLSIMKYNELNLDNETKDKLFYKNALNLLSL